MKTPATSSDPYLGRFKSSSVRPPHTVGTVKSKIAKEEDIKILANTSLFLTPYSQSPMDDTSKVILNSNGPGSTTQEPLALIAKLSDSERSILESGRKGGLGDSKKKLPGVKYRASKKYSYFSFRDFSGEVHYQLFSDGDEIRSNVAFDPNEPSLGRIRIDSIAPSHTPATIKRCISRIEETPEIVQADLFANISSDAPLKEGHISFLRKDAPGLDPDDPMTIVQPIPESPVSDGRYLIKNAVVHAFWNAYSGDKKPMGTVNFFTTATKEDGMSQAIGGDYLRVNDHSPFFHVFKE